MIPKNGPEGTVELVDEAGKAVFQLLPAFMYEKDNPEVSKAVETKFHWDQNELYCNLILDPTWLKDKKRQYPIIVDPIVTPALTSSGRTSHRTLIQCPENGRIKCQIDLDGPHWHGDASRHHRAHVYFRDNTTGQYLLGEHYSTDSYHPAPYEGEFIVGHEYELYLYAGETRRIDGKRYKGQAWATIEYGNGESLFADLPDAQFFTGINNNIILKSVDIKHAQTVKYRYVRESSNTNLSVPLSPYFRITPGPIIPPPGSNEVEGEILLNPGHYQFELSPSINQHYRMELEFPLGTEAYEQKIVLRTNPGSIESTFMLPSKGDVCLQYRTIRNDLPSSIKANPSIKITSSADTIFPRQFSLDYYNIIEGGAKVELEKEKLYTLTVTRGQGNGGGWGGINLDFFYPENIPCTVNTVQLIDQSGNPVEREYAAPDYGLRFLYQDEENHTLKAYTFYIGDQEYSIKDLNADNGWITLPHRIRDFGLYSGTTFQSIIKAYDGFDVCESSLGNFTVDSTPPVIDEFTGEVTNEGGNNHLNLVCRAHDTVSDKVQKGVISWKVQDQAGGTIPWSDGQYSYSIPDLPANAQVEVVFSVTDLVGNNTSLTKNFYTYPDRAELTAPVQIFTTKPGKYHPTLKFTKTGAPEYRIQRYLRQGTTDILEYDTGYMDADTLSTVTILPPGLNIISPANGSSFGRPAHITLTALTDENCEVYKVDFYADGELIDSVTNSPFRALWRDVAPGVYTLTAVATDTDGLTQTSPEVVIEVTNEKPEVRIVSPINGDSYDQPAKIYIMVEPPILTEILLKLSFLTVKT